ncbi:MULTISPECIES: outer membrane protein assembly factor BamE [unclassified Sphingomonas]|uniref:outer membrane protein assembly factor BamE n=1 Tax=unclassified Sphingomonas TaxID=196159 RepID=UPI000BCD1042|nr:MAG: cell envelope protein SmpA [Sphingomonas sp. 12-62-6]OYX40342.1 MAG: cell envelope protein SmpA [Sphingomonas sp. 32-62-10]OYY64608.1 MAG: cell envelope protein SmpA [Sphingomonas sp. 28-62-11]
MKLLSARMGMLLLISVAGVSLSGCARLKGHQGYVVDVDLVNSVQPGVDTRASVAQVLGKPTFTSTFDEREWYYVSRDTKFYAYNNPKVRDQMVLRVRFDDKGVVSAVDRTGVEQVASINPYGKTTPTLGRSRTFFQDLFGNIGSVGSGQGPQGQGQGGGTRDQP